MKRAGAFLLAIALLLTAGLWVWISLSLPFEDELQASACGSGPFWIGFQALQKLLAAAGLLAALVCAYGATRYLAGRGGLSHFGYGGAAVSFTFFGWILLMGITYTVACT